MPEGQPRPTPHIPDDVYPRGLVPLARIHRVMRGAGHVPPLTHSWSLFPRNPVPPKQYENAGKRSQVSMINENFLIVLTEK